MKWFAKIGVLPLHFVVRAAQGVIIKSRITMKVHALISLHSCYFNQKDVPEL